MRTRDNKVEVLFLFGDENEEEHRRCRSTGRVSRKIKSVTNLLVILGPTASGKTRLGVELARKAGAEILSVDSRQVYRGLDIGSGKDLDEYAVGGPRISYHLIDIVDLDVEFNVFEFQRRFFEVFEDLRKRATPPIAVGGSGLYLEAVLKAYRMIDVPRDDDLRSELLGLSQEELGRRLSKLRQAHNTTDLGDRDRLIRAVEIAEYSTRHEPAPSPKIEALVLGVRWDRAVLRRRIWDRLGTRMKGGLIEEVEALHAGGVSWEKLSFLGLEYRYISEYLNGEIRNRNDLKQKLGSAICAFAKKQETWFRRMQRRGVEIHWIDQGNLAEACRVIDENGGFAGIGDRSI